MATGKRLGHRKGPAGRDLLCGKTGLHPTPGEISPYSPFILTVGNVFPPNTNTWLPKAPALHPQSLAGGRGGCRACAAPPAPGPEDKGIMPCSKLEYPCKQHAKAQPVPMETHQNEFDRESSRTLLPSSVRKQCQVSPFVVTIIYSSSKAEVPSPHGVAPAGLQGRSGEHQVPAVPASGAPRELGAGFMCA